ncbi:hypothetical protein PAHAL_1G069400 [Panicum hallii]|uniref:Uncharacterized protein n=1 Tax=Panicum hallii TaxID=206008 RepID=A0A2T8KU96_9POAL|nr:hypothetical protein PAHAL_1G069400 [Panicum hallii]
MRGSRVSGLLQVHVVAFFVMILGCLALPGHCHTQKAGRAWRSYPNSLTNSSSSSNAPMAKNTSADERKLTLKFCVSDFCNHNLCYCCLYRRKCYPTWAACQARCPTCNPECPPAPITYATPCAFR